MYIVNKQILQTILVIYLILHIIKKRINKYFYNQNYQASKLRYVFLIVSNFFYFKLNIIKQNKELSWLFNFFFLLIIWLTFLLYFLSLCSSLYLYLLGFALHYFLYIIIDTLKLCNFILPIISCFLIMTFSKWDIISNCI